MDICFEGIGQMVATFATREKLAPGMAVTLTGSGEVGLGKKEGGSALCGVTVGAERGGAVAVQIGGVVRASCSDEAAFDVGYTTLACDSEGKVAVGGENGAGCLVLAVDRNEKTVTVRL